MADSEYPNVSKKYPLSINTWSKVFINTIRKGNLKRSAYEMKPLNKAPDFIIPLPTGP